MLRWNYTFQTGFEPAELRSQTQNLRILEQIGLLYFNKSKFPASF